MSDPASQPSLPQPLTLDVRELKLDLFPTGPGVIALEDAAGGTLSLVATANVRRAVASRLEPLDPAAGKTRRIDFAALTSRVWAVSVESAFEADWTYLRQARRRLPQTYQVVLDRWRPWFVHCDPADAHPQFVKTVKPGLLPRPGGSLLGPFADKHAAGRYLDMLQDAFDLCRHYHLLVQAPHASACAYKEMGRCPAPCDGSVSMDHYRGQIREAIAFASTPHDRWRDDVERRMKQASDSLDFERARQCRNLLDRTRPASRPEFSHVRDLGGFRFLALMRAATFPGVRAFLIRGGDIRFVGDVDSQPSIEQVQRWLDAAAAAEPAPASDVSDEARENMGLACHHLFHSRRSARGVFMCLDETPGHEDILRQVRTILRPRKADKPGEKSPLLEEQDLESEI